MATPESAEESIFLAALEKPTREEQLAYVDQACAGDPALRKRVLELLASHAESSGPLDTPPPGLSATYMSSAASAQGDQIGPYKLLGKIGEGGFGIVYMADQHEPVRRRVALKIIKPGMDSKQVLTRFEAERHALAMMDHPNIARALDAGATDNGRPYFVMELVRGVPITDYCDQQNLDVTQRLDLFVSICHAVQHAHQKGIIHRDIKPSNVLVTMQDCGPVPKVIDFGVAKAINQQLTQETIFTRFSEMVGTPLYMSPEQAEMTTLDIDTRSDIYSLGVLLYELLTGTTPFERERLKKAAFDEIRRIIREEEPAKPSTRISTLGDTSAATAAHRHVEPRQLSQLMRGDLDWIVMKALEKDRTRRYETANGLAMDIQRHLADEPVSAGPPSASYRFRKFARRNRAALGMATVLTVALLLGIVGTTSQAIRATTQRDRAVSAERLAQKRLESETAAREAEADQRREAEAQRQQAEVNFRNARAAVDEYFTLVSESRLLDVPGLQPLRKELLEAALRYYETFFDQRSSDPKVQVELAATWLRVAQVHQQNNLVDDAVGSLKKAIEIIETLERENPDAEGFPAALAGFRKDGRILTFWGLWPRDTPEAIRVYQKACVIWERFARDNPNIAGFRSDLAWYYRHVSDLQMHVKQPADSYENAQRSCRLWEALRLDEPSEPEYQAGLAESLERIAISLRDTGRIQEREAASRRALAIRQTLVRDHPSVADYRAGLGCSFRRLGGVLAVAHRPREAEQAYRHAIEVWEALTTEFPAVPGYQRQLADTNHHLAALLKVNNRPKEAEAAIRKAVEIHLTLAAAAPGERGDNLTELDISLGRLDEICRVTGQTQDTADVYRRSIGIIEEALKKLADDRHSREALDRCYQLLGRAYQSIGQPEQAKATFRRGAALTAEFSAEFPDVPSYREAVGHQNRLLAFALSDTAEAEEKEQAFLRALSIFEQLASEHPDMPHYAGYQADTHYQLGRLFDLNKRYDDSEQAYEQCVAVQEKLSAQFPANEGFKLTLANWLNDFGTMLKTAGRSERSEKEYRGALAVKEDLAATHPLNTDYRFHLAHTNLGLGYLLNDLKRSAEAETFFRDAHALFQQIAAEVPSNEYYRMDTGHALWHLGYIAASLGRPDDSEDCHRQALAIFEKLAAEAPANAFYRFEQGFSYWTLGDALASNGNPKEAADAYRGALAVYAKLAADVPNNVEYQSRLARSHRLLIDLFLKQEEHAEAAKVAVALSGIHPEAREDQERCAADLMKCAALARSDESLEESERKSVAEGYAKQAEDIRSKTQPPKN